METKLTLPEEHKAYEGMQWDIGAYGALKKLLSIYISVVNIQCWFVCLFFIIQ